MKRFLLFCALALAAYWSSSGRAEGLPLILSESALTAKAAIIEKPAADMAMGALGGEAHFSQVKWNGEAGAFAVKNGVLEVDRATFALSYANAKLVNRIVVDLPFVGRQERIEETGLPSHLEIAIESKKALLVKLPKSVDVVFSNRSGKSEIRLTETSKAVMRLAMETAIREGEWDIRVGGKRLDEAMGPLGTALHGWIVGELASQMSQQAVEQTFYPAIEVPRWISWLLENGKEEVALALSGWKVD